MAKGSKGYRPELLRLKITLEGSDPAIWRRVEVHNGLFLDDLHEVIQCVFLWNESHLYRFVVPPQGPITRRRLVDAQRFDCGYGDFDDGEENLAQDVLIGDVLDAGQSRLVYEYDFGDGWLHLVEVEQRVEGGDPDQIPVCLAGEQAAPIDDIGGIGGYYDWLEALKDPTHEDHEDALEYLGKDFAHRTFDLAESNRRLQSAFGSVLVKPEKPKASKKPKKKPK